MTLTSTPQNSHRLRTLIESWDEAGLLAPGLAARALMVQPGTPDPEIQSSIWLRRLEALGYVGAIPVGAAGLLMARSWVGIGSLFLIGVLIALASPQAVRASTKRPVALASRPAAPRHRADRHLVPVPFRGPPAHGVMLKGRGAERRQIVNVAPMNSR